jgi:hypothetical protein
VAEIGPAGHRRREPHMQPHVIHILLALLSWLA